MKLKQVMIQAACAALAMGSAAVAFAGTQPNPSPASPVVVGGGASLPEFLYSSEIAVFGPNHIYAVTGSGGGKTALTTNNPAAFNAAYVTPRTDTTVHYAGSDSVLSASDISAFSPRAGTDGALVQIPSVGTAVGIPFKKTGLSTLTLNDNQLCGVFSGKITDWSAITGGAVSGPITVVYRSDGSGTSEIFTRHLNAVCTTGASGNSNVAFVTSTKFTDSFPGGVVPSNFVGGNLSAGVRDGVGAGNAIGYLSPDYINKTLAPLSTVATQNLTAASLVNSNNGVTYTPSSANATTALSNLTLPTLSSNLADPNTWALTVANPATGYPIAGLTYLDHVQCYSDATVLSKIQTFLDRHTTYSGTNSNAGRILGNGFAQLPSALVSLIRDNLLNNVNGKNVNIGNTTACAGKAGR
ncbi:Alkaline phosphatase L [Ralstonia edaphis]|uniref:Alkaline phosphatase L n=1 Tax=Ralstonia edaphi TaxID=3058599 RepID=A0AB72X3V4_9RALS|nr:substrate-binding domain-containing protein [Ralstonia sp. LMG 6871]CAJ0742348.1 Alkaline phosphatase L [Ralstonia sp. LMG 6871]